MCEKGNAPFPVVGIICKKKKILKIKKKKKKSQRTIKAENQIVGKLIP